MTGPECSRQSTSVLCARVGELDCSQYHTVPHFLYTLRYFAVFRSRYTPLFETLWSPLDAQSLAWAHTARSQLDRHSIVTSALSPHHRIHATPIFSVLLAVLAISIYRTATSPTQHRFHQHRLSSDASLLHHRGESHASHQSPITQSITHHQSLQSSPHRTSHQQQP